MPFENKPMTDGSCPIEIAGAGPAGLVAAITLAQNGHRVVVHEAHAEVGSRFGGDFQGLENWTTEADVLEVMRTQGLTTAFMAMPCARGWVFDPKRRGYEICSREPLFYMIERGPGPDSLDSALLNQALELGVEVKFNSRLRHLDGEAILAVGPRAADAIAVGFHFDCDMANGFWVICDDELAPKGYAYLLVMNGRGTVKTCIFEGFNREKHYVEQSVEAFKELVGLEMKNPVPHGGSGNFRIPKSGYSGAHAQVGEQAGFQDTLWGFGLRLAMTSGTLAAKSLMNRDDYDHLWKSALLPQMRTSIVNRVLYANLGNLGYRWFLSNFSSRRDLRAVLRWHYSPSWIKSLLVPWARMKYRSHRSDVACHHVNCNCVYCRGQCVDEGF